MTAKENEEQNLDNDSLFEKAIRAGTLRMKKELETAQSKVDEEIESSLKAKEQTNEAIKKMNEMMKHWAINWYTEHAGAPGAITATIKSPNDMETTDQGAIETIQRHWQRQSQYLAIDIDASAEQSRARWNARKTELSERVRQCALDVMCDLALEQQRHRHWAISYVALIANRHCTLIAESEMDENLKEECIKKMWDICRSTLEQI